VSGETRSARILRQSLQSSATTGTGMSAEVIERAFEPFFATKEIGKGTGLGLSTVFGVVRQSGEAVRIRNRLGEGSMVQIDLPRASSAAMAAATKTVPLPPDERWRPYPGRRRRRRRCAL